VRQKLFHFVASSRVEPISTTTECALSKSSASGVSTACTLTEVLSSWSLETHAVARFFPTSVCRRDQPLQTLARYR
jgi:hypothetical protein